MLLHFARNGEGWLLEGRVPDYLTGPSKRGVRWEEQGMPRDWSDAVLISKRETYPVAITGEEFPC